MDRSMKRYGSAKMKDEPGKNVQKSEAAAESKAESTASGKDAPHATPRAEGKTVEMKPNATGATAEAADPHAEMIGRHGTELDAMHKRHQQAMADMHKMHADEMKQMHGRHGTEIGNGAGATATEGPTTPSAKKLAGKGWKSQDKGKSGTEPKGDKK